FAPGAADCRRIVLVCSRIAALHSARGRRSACQTHVLAGCLGLATNAGIGAMKTIVGSFDSFDEAKRVARELMDDGFRDADVSVVASNIRSGTGTSSGANVGAPADTSTG